MQRRAPWLSALVFAISALAAVATMWHAWQATGGRTSPWTVAAVAAWLVTLPISLAWLVYTLAASRERYARRAAESDASLKREEAETRKLSLVARHATDLVLITDATGRIEWVNDAFVRASGYGAADVTGSPVASLLHGPDSPPAAATAVQAALTSGTACRVESVAYTRAGQPFEVILEMQPVPDGQGAIGNFIVMARDVTAERRAQDALVRSERKYRRVVEQVEQVIFQLDTEGNWTFLNRAWTGLTGGDVDAALGHSMLEALHPDDRAVAQSLCAELIACRKDECQQDLRFVTGSGAIRWGAVHARPMKEDGVFIGIAGTITDVSARRQVQQELEQASEAAERASAAKTEFLKSMSHEMRTPLNGVLGLMELLAATRLDEQQARYVAVARASATHLSVLIADILDLSRLEAGAFTLERTLYDLPDLIESTVDVVTAEASIKRLRLSCTVKPEVPTWVIGDPGRLRQVVVNLLVNAVKFTERGEVHVEAGADVDLQTRKALVRIEVRDTGIGMTPELVERLFLPFTPGDTSSTRRHSGTGLGLTICKRLMDAMGGTITARSVEHVGATFTLELPLEVADAAMVESQRHGDAPVRVLAVLPDEADRADIGRLLDGWRLEATVVGDCDSALTHLEALTSSRWRFRAVLLDGAATGAAALARRLRELDPSPGVVWITAEDAQVPDELAGARDRIVRPVRGAALFDAIMQAVVGSASAVTDAPKTPEWTRPLRVLVAEDHEINQMVVKEMLLAMRCDVDLVATGEQAVAAVLGTPYDVVLMDCQMPVLDGLEATRQIRAAHAAGRIRHAPRIIALTAYATDQDRQACLDAGMDAYLTKPMRGPVLQRTLQRLLTDHAVGPAADGEPRRRRPPGTGDTVSEWMRADAPDVEDILDPAEVLLRCNQNGDLGARMLQMFAETLPAELEALEAAAAAGDMDALGRIAHKMRGAAATLAAVRLAGAITGIELFLQYGDGGPLSELLGDVRHESALLLGVVPQTIRRLGARTPGAPPPPF